MKNIYNKLLIKLYDIISRGCEIRDIRLIKLQYLVNQQQKLKCDNNVWTEEEFNENVNTLEEWVYNNNENELIDKYLLIINEYKNMACIENI